MKQRERKFFPTILKIILILIFLFSTESCCLINLSPLAPTGVSASDGTYTDKVRISWNSVSGADNYYIYRATSSGGSYSSLDSTSNTYYDDPTATAGTTYYYKVKTYDNELYSSYSSYDSGWRQTTISPVTPEGINVALSSNGATATAISEGSYSGNTCYAHEAIDGRLDNGWSSDWDMPAWLTIEFDQVYNIDTVAVSWGSHKHDFTIALSLNGADWTTVKTGTSNNLEGESSVYEIFSITSQNAKYMKITITSTSAPNSHIFQSSVDEIEAYQIVSPSPTAPTGVSASDGTYTDKVRISWNSVSGADSYYVYRAVSSDGTYNSLGSTSNTYYDDPTATAGTTYYYKVKTYDNELYSSYSSYDSGWRKITEPTPPLAPTGVSASDGTYTDKVRISWNSVSGADNYYIYRATSSGGSYSSLDSTSNTYYDDPTATAGTTYYYKVKTYDNELYSSYSSYDSGWRQTTISPVTPEGINVALSSNGATATAISEGSYSGNTCYAHEAIDGRLDNGWSSDWDMPAWLTIEFDQVYNIDTVAVSWGSHKHDFTIALSLNGADWTTVKTGTSNNLEGESSVYEIFSITSQNAKYMKITITSTSAPNSHIFQSSVDEIEAYQIVSSSPTAPTGVSASDGTYTDKVRISWNSVSGADSYYVYRAVSSDGTYNSLGSTSNTYYDDPTATAGTTYYYKVKTYDNELYSSYSSYDSGWRKITEPTPPLAPTGVSASDGTYTDKVRISWNSVSGADNYYIYRATSSGGSYSSLDSTSNTYYDDPTATAGTTYYYKVKTYDNELYSSYSSYDSGWRQTTIERSINVTNPSSSSDWGIGTLNTITWNSSNAGSYVKIDLYKNGSYCFTIISSTINDGSYIWTVPSSISVSSGYEIRITSTAYTSTYDESHKFDIIIPTIKFTPPYLNATTWRAGYDASVIIGNAGFYTTESANTGLITHYAVASAGVLGGSGVVVSNLLQNDIKIPKEGSYYIDFKGEISYITQTAGVKFLVGFYKGLFDIELKAGINGVNSKKYIIKDAEEALTVKGYLDDVVKGSIDAFFESAPLFAIGKKIKHGIAILEAYQKIRESLPDELELKKDFTISVPFTTAYETEEWFFQLISETDASTLGLSAMFSNLGIVCKLESVTLRPR